MVDSLNQFFCLHRRNLLVNLIFRNFRTKFRGSILGYLWTLVIPLSQVVVFYFVYQVVLKIPIPNYLAFIVLGVMPWVFFSSTVNESFETLVAGQNLLTHLPVPIQVFPAATVMTNFVSLALAMPVMLGVLLWSGIPFNTNMLWAIPLLAGLVLFTYCLSLILACLYVLFRDLKYIFAIVLSLWIYATPVFYSMDLVPAQFHWLFYVNPLTGFFVGFRDALMSTELSHPEVVIAFFAWTTGMFLVANVVRATLAMKVVERL